MSVFAGKSPIVCVTVCSVSDERVQTFRVFDHVETVTLTASELGTIEIDGIDVTSVVPIILTTLPSGDIVHSPSQYNQM